MLHIRCSDALVLLISPAPFSRWREKGAQESLPLTPRDRCFRLHIASSLLIQSIQQHIGYASVLYYERRSMVYRCRLAVAPMEHEPLEASTQIPYCFPTGSRAKMETVPDGSYEIRSRHMPQVGEVLWRM